MPDALQLTPPDGLARLARALTAYQRVSGKLASAVLAQKGAQLVYGNSDPRFGATFPGLVSLFQRQIQKPNRISIAARIRGFRLGRRNFGSSQTGISATALQRATFWMGGHSSILAVPSQDQYGRLILGALRVGKRGRRILGGRKGRGGAAVSGDFAGPLLPGEKRLNLRAVATIMELHLREAGRRYLGASFLFTRWRKLARSDPRWSDTTWRYIAQVNPRAKLQLQAEAELSGDTDSGNATLRITSFVPGAKEVGESRGIFARAIDAVAADTEAYLQRKLLEAAADTLSAA